MCGEILACLCPPLAVCWKRGCCNFEVCLSILLTLIGYFPGCLFACYIVGQKTKANIQVTQVTHVQAPQPVVAQPQHVTVHVPQYLPPQAPNNAGHYYPQAPMNPHYPSPSAGPVNVPPPMYTSAPPYYGQGDSMTK